MPTAASGVEDSRDIADSSSFPRMENGHHDNRRISSSLTHGHFLYMMAGYYYGSVCMLVFQVFQREVGPLCPGDSPYRKRCHDVCFCRRHGTRNRFQPAARHSVLLGGEKV